MESHQTTYINLDMGVKIRGVTEGGMSSLYVEGRIMLIATPFMVFSVT